MIRVIERVDLSTVYSFVLFIYIDMHSPFDTQLYLCRVGIQLLFAFAMLQ